MAKLFLILIIFISSFLKSFSFNADELSKYDDFKADRSCIFYDNKGLLYDMFDFIDDIDELVALDAMIDVSRYLIGDEGYMDYDKSNVEYDIVNKNIIPDKDKYLANNQVFVPQELTISDYSGYGCLKDYMIGYLVWRSTLAAAVFMCGGKSIIYHDSSKEDLKNKKFSVAVATLFGTFNPANDLIDFVQALIKCSDNYKKLASVLLPPIAIIIGYYADGVEKMRSARRAAKQIVVCGHNWQLWGDNGYDTNINDDDKKYSSQYKFDYIKRNNKVFYGYYSYLKKFALIGNKEIRELQNKGVERKNFNCKNPNFSKDENNYNHQKYYFRGSEAAHYDCQQYHPRKYDLNKKTQNSRKDYEDAYNCCIRYQTKSICLENLSQKFDDDNKQKECNKADNCYYQHCIEDENCEVKNIKGQRSHNSSSEGSRNLDIYYSNSDSSNTKICAKTNDICPFNIPIALGIEKTKCEKYQDLSLADSTKIQEIISEQEKEDKKDFFEASKICGKYKTRKWNNESNICEPTSLVNQCKNYCAIDNHCVKITPAPKENNSNDYSAFFSSACIDFRGSSKMEGSLLTPLAQCFRETASNFLFNKAGRSTGNYLKGDIVMESSFLTQMQDLVKDSITIAMVIAVILVGLGLLIGANQFDKKAVMFLVAQIALISWFALGDAWKKTFFDIIYNTSTTFVSLVNSISKEHKDEVSNDSYYKIEKYKREKIIDEYITSTFEHDYSGKTEITYTIPIQKGKKNIRLSNVTKIKKILFPKGKYYANIRINSSNYSNDSNNTQCKKQKTITYSLEKINCEDEEVYGRTALPDGGVSKLINNTTNSVIVHSHVCLGKKDDNKKYHENKSYTDRYNDKRTELSSYSKYDHTTETHINKKIQEVTEFNDTVMKEAHRCENFGDYLLGGGHIFTDWDTGLHCHASLKWKETEGLIKKICETRKIKEYTTFKSINSINSPKNLSLNIEIKSLTENNKNITINYISKTKPEVKKGTIDGNKSKIVDYNGSDPEIGNIINHNGNEYEIYDIKEEGTDYKKECYIDKEYKCSRNNKNIILFDIVRKNVKIDYLSLQQENIIAPTGKESCIFKTSELVNNSFKDTYECKRIFSQKNDGCYFHPGEYQKGDQYLAIWDTMDCKIRLYLGFGSSKWGILGLILSSVVTGAWGMYLAIATLAFGIFVFILAANILYMFVFSSFLLVLLVFVSPITITLSLFSATRGVFNDWFKEFMSFALQPIILFFYMAFAILMFDKFMIGDALFIDEQKEVINISLNNELFGKENMCLKYGGKYENARCTKQGDSISLPKKEKFCEETLGGEYSKQQVSCLNIFVPPSKRPYTPSCDQYYLDNSGKYHKDKPSNGTYELVTPEETSPVCVLQSEATGAKGFFNLFATPIRALFSVTTNFDDSGLKSMAITMLEVVIFMYIISMFTAKIPQIAADLTNGTALPQTDFGVISIIKQGSNFASGAAKRFGNSFKRPIDDNKDNRTSTPSEDSQKDNRTSIPDNDTQNQNDDVTIDKKK